MITIYFSDKEIEIGNNHTLAQLLKEKFPETNDYAVALNQHFVPRIDYSTTILKPNDRVDIIVPMQGG